MLCHLYLVLSLSSLLGSLSFSLTSHIHLTILISARWSATTFSFLTGQVSLPCNMLLCTQLLYNLPLIIKDTSLLVSSGTSCLNLFQPIQILASTAASASPSTLYKSIYKTCCIFHNIHFSYILSRLWQTLTKKQLRKLKAICTLIKIK